MSGVVSYVQSKKFAYLSAEKLFFIAGPLTTTRRVCPRSSCKGFLAKEVQVQTILMKDGFCVKTKAE